MLQHTCSKLKMQPNDPKRQRTVALVFPGVAVLVLKLNEARRRAEQNDKKPSCLKCIFSITSSMLACDISCVVVINLTKSRKKVNRFSYIVFFQNT